jgi:HAD superfamily hydrolase (TIGR01509 family)
MDGVLVDSGAAHALAWQRLGNEVGTPFGPELFRRTFGQRNESIIPTWLGSTVSTERAAQLGLRKEALYRTLVREGCVKVYGGAASLMRELHAAGAAVAIASSGPRANIELLIDIMQAACWIDAVVAAEDVTHGKPDPEVFIKAAAALSVPAPACAVIEDSVHGIEAARRAGMYAVAVLTSTPRADLEAAGAECFAPEISALDAATLLRVLRART